NAQRFALNICETETTTITANTVQVKVDGATATGAPATKIGTPHDREAYSAAGSVVWFSVGFGSIETLGNWRFDDISQAPPGVFHKSTHPTIHSSIYATILSSQRK